LGYALSDIISGAVRSTIATEVLKQTVLSAVLAAVTWPATLLAAADIIDNPWNVCTNRAKQCGYMLADVLLSKKQGCRPVTLVGFSLGARVIFYCLTEMARHHGVLIGNSFIALLEWGEGEGGRCSDVQMFRCSDVQNILWFVQLS
jgi:hypothetical protein